MAVIWMGTGRFSTPLLLDLYPNAAAAYSLRQLRTGVTNVVRVRRSSDNTESDFTATQVSDGTLTAWVGAGNNGFVQTWYDQSGNGNNAVQATTGRQPRIVSGGALVGGGIDFDGTDDYLVLNQLFVGRAARSVFCSVDADTTTTNEAIYAGTSGGSATGTIWNFSAETAIRLGGNVAWLNDPMTSASVGSIHLPLNGLIEDHSFYRNGQLKTQTGSTNGSSIVDTQAAANSFIGASHVLDYYDGKIQELVIYASYQIDNRVGIESNINDHYSIF